MLDGVVAEKKIETKSNSDLDDRKSLLLAEKGEIPDNETWETQLFQVYKGSASLRYPHIRPGDVTPQYTLEPSLLPLQEGVAVMPDTAQVSAYHTKERKGVIFTALGGRVELAIPNFEQTKAVGRLATMNIVSDQVSDTAGGQQTETMADQISAQTDDTEISAYLREPVVITLADGLQIMLGQGEYIKNKNDRNPKLRFWQTRLVFARQNLTNDFATELDQTGLLHAAEGQDIRLDDKKTGSISAAQALEILKEGGAREPEATETVEEKAAAEEQPEEEPQAVQPQKEQTQEEWKEFQPGDLTEDGFVKMEEAEYELKKEGDTFKEQYGKAKFRFMEIPYTIPLFDKKEFKGRTKPKEPNEAMQTFYVGPSGKLFAEFDEPIELSLIGDEKVEQYIVAAIRLEGASIKGSRLIAEKLRIDLGVESLPGEDNEEEQTAKKLFGKNVHGTFASLSAVDHIDDEGIHAAPGRKSLGRFEVSKFLGFLDAEGDYPSGRLKVAFENQKEADKPRLFSETVQNLMGDGLCLPILGPLAFEINISPSVSIGGSLSAELDRKKSFGEPLESGESMELSGKAGIAGEGKLNMAAGLALTPGLLSSVKLDLKLGSELSAGIGVTATADTALGLRDEKLKQTKPLDLDGKVEIDLQGTVSLSSNVKFFVFNATLFKVELWNKEVHIQPFQGHASRDVDAGGLTQGWHFETMGLSAKGLGQKTVEAMRNSQEFKMADEKKLEMSKEAADSLGKEVENAWTLLEELNRQNALSEDRAYLIDEKEKAALQNRIQTVTKEVEDKISRYMDALNQYKAQLYKKQEETQKNLEDARKEHSQCVEQDTIRQMAMRDVQRGGLLLEKYLPLSQEESKGMTPKKIERENEKRNKMAAIDFTIARALGIYDKAMDDQIYEYDMMARERNIENQVDKRQGNHRPGQEFIYPLFKELDEYQFLSGIRDGDKYRWGGADATLRYHTRFGRDSGEDERGYHINNYFHVLNYKKFYMESIPLSYRSDFIPIFTGKNAQGIRNYDFVRILLSGVYPKGTCDDDGNSLEGKPIQSLDTDRKTKLFKSIFKGTLSKEDKRTNFYRRLLGGDYQLETTQRDKMMVDVNKILQEVFGSNLDDMVADGNIDMNGKLKELDDKLETSKVDYINAKEKHYEVESAIMKVEKEQLRYQAKLFGLRYDVENSVKLEEGSVRAAKAAVNFVQEDYEAVAVGGKLPDLAVNGISEDSDVYKEMKKLEQEAFPERKNAMKALKAPIAQ